MIIGVAMCNSVENYNRSLKNFIVYFLGIQYKFIESILDDLDNDTLFFVSELMNE